MTYSPPILGRTDSLILSTLADGLVDLMQGTTATGASGTGQAAASAYFFPVRLARRRTFVKAWWLNGATVAGNVDVGIYTISGATATRIVASTAEAQAGASVMQIAATFTTTTIGPGLYYLAIAASLATATFWRSAGTSAVTRPFLYSAATSHPLPATATVVASTVGNIPVFGFAELATI